jgi:hypothetical protein
MLCHVGGGRYVWWGEGGVGQTLEGLRTWPPGKDV